MKHFYPGPIILWLGIGILLYRIVVLDQKIWELQQQDKMLWQNVDVTSEIGQQMVEWKIKNFGSSDEVTCWGQK